jgi:hypothetical protein
MTMWLILSLIANVVLLVLLFVYWGEARRAKILAAAAMQAAKDGHGMAARALMLANGSAETTRRALD